MEMQSAEYGKYFPHLRLYSGIHSLSEMRDQISEPVAIKHGYRMEAVARRWKPESFKDTWNVFEGATVLDLGCGSEFSRGFSITFAPYFARLMAGQGALVYGADALYAGNEDWVTYNHITTDIVPWILDGTLAQMYDTRADKGIEGITFDIINATSFLCDGFAYDQRMNIALRDKNVTAETVKDQLILQATSMLNENGILALEDEFFRKENGALIKID